LNVEDPASIKAVSARLIVEHPKLNMLINNAGIMQIADAAGAADEDLLVSTIATNLMGPIRMTGALIEKIVQIGPGGANAFDNPPVLDNIVVDSASIEVNRRARRAKTDRLDGDKLLAMLLRYAAGERRVWSVVRVPTLEQEDARRAHRELGPAGEVRWRAAVAALVELPREGASARCTLVEQAAAAHSLEEQTPNLVAAVGVLKLPVSDTHALAPVVA
jgi:hypothetical protein